MAFDFFNEGLKKESAIEFSKEEDMFLQAKLPFLDPKKTQLISIGSVLEFLKFSGIRSQGIQKILRNCKVEKVVGKKNITYNEMKKIFRGVALHQADIEPSTINIEANIKTKMPIFYDESDDEEAPEPPPKPQPPKAQEQKQPKAEKVVEPVQDKPVHDTPPNREQAVPDKTKKVFSFEAPAKPPTHPPPPPVQPQQASREKQNGLAIKMREFEARWVKLKTEGDKISGPEVKSLCKNLGQRSNLSKAWKLCCHTHSGALSKGEFFVFLEIVANPHVPEALTQEMKQCIAMLDQPRKETKPQDLLPPQQPPQKLASSMIFQNFGKADSFVEVRGRVKTEEKIELAQLKDLSKTQSQLQEVSKIAENHGEDLTAIRRGQETMNNVLGEVEQFLSSVRSKNGETKEQVEELKGNQQMLNDRLNKVCIALNGIIVSQNALIDQLVNESANQNNTNLQRISFLQNHVVQLTEQLRQRELAIKKILHGQEQPKQAPPEKRGEKQPEEEPRPVDPSPKKNEQVPESKEVPEEQQESPQFQVEQGSPQVQEEEKGEVAEMRMEREDGEYEQRMKMKRAQVIQLIMHLTPLTPEEEPALIQRIREYTEEELNTVYFNCFQKLKAKQQAEQKAAQKAPEPRESRPPEDEFSSSNFHGQAPAPQQDMFA